MIDIQCRAICIITIRYNISRLSLSEETKKSSIICTLSFIIRRAEDAIVVWRDEPGQDAISDDPDFASDSKAVLKKYQDRYVLNHGPTILPPAGVRQSRSKGKLG